MTVVMIRSFDHAGYYETRLILLVTVTLLSLFYLVRKGDGNYLAMLLFGALFQGLMELTLKYMGLRGQAYTLSVFGLTLPSSLTWMFQGLTEGGVHAFMGYGFMDVYLNNEREHRRRRSLYIGLLFLVLLFSLFVGLQAGGREITSARPMFKPGPILGMFYITFFTLVIAAFKGGETYRYCALFFAGTFIYTLLNLGPLQPMGVRYIGAMLPDGTMQPLSPVKQGLIMLYSHAWEVTGSRFHYFVLPFVLGVVRLRKPGLY